MALCLFSSYFIIASGHLVGIEPGTHFAPSQSHTTYVLWDTSMNKLTINEWTIILEDHLFNIEPTIGTATIDINNWRPPAVTLDVTGATINTNIGGYTPNKHYRLYINGNYQSIQADQNGQLIFTTLCTTIETTGEWDINLDGIVNYLEISLIVSTYAQTGTPGWIPEDINDDGRINYIDVSFVVGHYQNPIY